MSILSLLKSELHWGKRNVVLLLFLLIVLPLVFAGVTVVFQDVVPTDVPVAVVPENENVTDQEVAFVEAGITQWSDPQTADSRADAEELLTRESVYAIVVVPPDYLEDDAEATFGLVIDGTIAPYQSPSELVTDLIQFELRAADGISENVTVEREIIRDEKDFAEYLYPTFMMGFLIFVAFTYVPYIFRRDAGVLDRLRVESSLEAVVGTKLGLMTALMAIPLLIFHLGALWFGYGVATATLPALGILLLTFLLLAAVSTAIMILTRFSGRGQFINLVVMLGVIGLSGLAFPLGFFSTVRSTIAQLLPTHYAMIIVRSLLLKDVGIAIFWEWAIGLVAVLIVALVVLEGTIIHYRRGAE